MKLFLFNSGQGPDYLADLIISQLITCKNVKVYCNLLPEYLFSDFDKEKHLYGRGYTVFRQLNPELRNKVIVLSEEEFLTYFSQRYFDRIIYTSIRRRSYQAQISLPDSVADYFEIVSSYYSKNEILVFDGEDETFLVESVVPNVTYYKRELLEKDSDKANPVSFTFPSYHQIPEKTEKEYFLAPCDPRLGSSYQFSTEQNYYLQYSKALFGFTKKKAGWDCMRHYEILACNCLPYFPDIMNKPRTTMMSYPISLQIKVNQLFEKIMTSTESFQYQTLSFGPRRQKEREISDYEKLNNDFQSWFLENSRSSIYEKIIIK